VSINTGTRNDYGRLGARDAQIYLASPASVAAAAVAGRIVDPRELSQ
jgi:homoaconitase/3-isopropylmalate dehydratase large subunit